MPIIGNILKALALYYVRKNAPHLLVNAFIETAEFLAAKTEPKTDDDAVAKFKQDKDEYIKIISQFL